MKIFNTLPKPRIKRSIFNLSHEVKLTGGMGRLIPFYVQETVPGDKFHIKTDSMIRLAPMLAPLYHRVNFYTHYFYVPNRIIWDTWEQFDRERNVIYAPIFDIQAEVGTGSLADYMGVPTNVYSSSNNCEVNQLPFRAFFSIFNEYFRDTNLNNEYDLEDLTVSDILTAPPFRAWEKDYFTSALTSPQQGAESAVPINVGIESYNAWSTAEYTNGNPVATEELVTDSSGNVTDSSADKVLIKSLSETPHPDGLNFTIADLRSANRVQEWLERNARAGNRYIEMLLNRWGVVSSDKSLQRPELIGGGKSQIMISEVLNTTDTTSNNTPFGDYAGHGIGVSSMNTAKHFCEEHGFIIGVMSVIPRSAYYQGLPKMFTRQVQLDYYQPEFAQLGEQEIKNGEIYHQGNPTYDDAAFGYTSRYAEYKYGMSRIAGSMRDDYDYWHLARKFSELPALNGDFVKCNPSERIFAAYSPNDELIVQLYNQVTAKRPLPFHNIPTL